MKINNKGFAFSGIIPALIILGVSATVAVPTILTPKTGDSSKAIAPYVDVKKQETKTEEVKKQEIKTEEIEKEESKKEAEVKTGETKTETQEKTDVEKGTSEEKSDSAKTPEIESELKVILANAKDVAEGKVNVNASDLCDYVRGDFTGEVNEVSILGDEIDKIVYVKDGYQATYTKDDGTKIEKID